MIRRRLALAVVAVAASLVVASTSPGRVEAAGNIVQIPAPAGSVAFGEKILVLTNGNYVITDETANPGGAVYLYDGTTNALISTLTGSVADDRVGYDVVDLQNGNFVVTSPFWHRAGLASVGAVTWVNGTTGLNGAVSTANSIVGSSANDLVGIHGATRLTNGNYVVPSPLWNSSSGAATFALGTQPTAETVSASNSLVGQATNSQVGFDMLALKNGNYVVLSPFWTGVGAATWADGTTGRAGLINVSNSLIGSTANDRVGSLAVELTDGDYVIGSFNWQSSLNVFVGAATWSSGTTPTIGPITSANSLIGSRTGDAIGDSIHAVGNGNYVVSSASWDNTASFVDAGAVTFGHGDGTTHGTVSPSNSLVGNHTADAVGISVVVLTNGNYVAPDASWLGGVGAVTWGSSTSGTVVGPVTGSNSLVGSHLNDQVGYNNIVLLTNGNYVVGSPFWANGSVTEAGRQRGLLERRRRSARSAATTASSARRCPIRFRTVASFRSPTATTSSARGSGTTARRPPSARRRGAAAPSAFTAPFRPPTA